MSKKTWIFMPSSTNAGYWTVTAAAADAGTNPPSPFNMTHGSISSTLTVGSSLTSVTPNVGLAEDFFNGTIANFAAGTFNFLGFKDGAGNTFFGFAFNNTTGANTILGFSSNASIPSASLGAVVDGFASSPTISLSGSNSISFINNTVANNGYMLFLWAGATLGKINMGGSISDGIFPSTITVNWLNGVGGSFTTAQTDATNSSSGSISLGSALWTTASGS